MLSNIEIHEVQVLVSFQHFQATDKFSPLSGPDYQRRDLEKERKESAM